MAALLKQRATTTFILILIHMANHGKKYLESKKLIDSSKLYSVAEAVEMVKKTTFTKFVPTVEIAIKTFANPKYNDQMIRSTTILPHGTGKTKRIAVFSAEDVAGADIVGTETLIADIKAGKFDFDILITTPEHIRDLAPIAKQLGPKGLMPSPKAGTVVMNLAQAVEEIKKGKIEFKLDKTGNIHAPVGKASFDDKQLEENITSFIKAVEDSRPTGVKGKLIKKIVLTTSMGPSVQIAQ